MSEQQNVQQQAQELAAKVTAPAQKESTPQQVDKVGEIPVDQLNAALKEAVGIDDYKSINQLKSYRTKAGELENRIKEMEAKLAINPYPNELVERLATMYKDGVDDSQIKQWMRIQTMDFSNPTAVIKQKIQLENPRYTPQMVDDVLDEMFGPKPNPDDDQFEYLEQKRNTKIQRAAIEAEEFLKNQLSNTSNPDVEQQREQAKKQAEAMSAAWGTVVDSVISQTNPLRFEVDDKNVGGKYFFEFSPPKDDNIQNIVKQTLIDQAVNQGMPLTEDGLKKVMELQQNLYWNIYRDEFLKQMAFDMYASIQESMVKARAKTVAEVPIKQQAPKPQQKKQSPFPAIGNRNSMV